MSPLLVISPHCDDAVFGCGALIASSPGSVVVTVFAGSPSSYHPFTEWDRAGGFVPGDDVMQLRRGEDRRALAIVDAAPVWLPFLDSQYGQSHAAEKIASALQPVVDDCHPRAIAFPLGLYHSDHALAHAAALTLVPRHDDLQWLLYEDTFYRRIPGAVQARTAALEAAGYRLREIQMPVRPDAMRRKRQAVLCYASQLKALATPGRPGNQDANAAEAFFELCRAQANTA